MVQLATKLIRSSFFRVLHLVANVVIAFFMMPFVIGVLGDRWYGLWLLLATLVGYSGFFDFGLSTAIERFISRANGRKDQEEKNIIFNTCLFLFSLAGLLSLITSVILVIVCPLFVDNPADVFIMRIVLILIGFDTALSIPLRAFDGYLAGHVRHDIVNIIYILKLFLRTAFIVFFLSRGHGIIAMGIITLGIDVLSYIATIVIVVRHHPELTVSQRYFARDHVRMLFGYSVYSFISNVADKLRFHLDSFVIPGFLGLAYVTHYSIGARIAGYYMLIIQNATMSIMPVFSTFEAQNNYDQIRDKFVLVAKLNTIASVFLGGLLLIFGKAFIIRWMGIDYLDSFYVFAALMVGLVFNTIQITSQSLLYGLSRHKMYSITVTVEGVANLVLSIILVQRYGIIGVAMGTTIPMLVTNLFIIPIYANRIIHLPLLRYLKVVVGSLLFSSAVHLSNWLIFRDLIIPSYTRILLLGATTSVIFLLLNGLVLLNRNERRYFKVPV